MDGSSSSRDRSILVDMTPHVRVQQLMRDGCANHAAGRIADAAILYLKALTIDTRNDGARHLFDVAAGQLGLRLAERQSGDLG
jgi:hypothetical protein